MISSQTLNLSQTHSEQNFLTNIAQKLEYFRIKNHLRLTEKQLRAKNISRLSPTLQKRRTENLDRLNDYWQAGQFPKNLDFSRKRVPYFIDAAGIPCAMAYLIAESGYRSLTNEVQRTNNHVYINDIKDGPVLEWIHNSGLTQKEAAKVQPRYTPHFLGQTLYFWFSIILPSILFIALEWLSYKVGTLIFPKAKKGKKTFMAYVTILNLAAALFLTKLILRLIF